MIGRIKSFLGDALFPERVVCLSCSGEAVVGDDGLCADCHEGLELFVSAPAPENTVGYTAAYIYNDVSSRMVIALKFANARYLAKPLADAITLPEAWTGIDAVVPVPLYYKREAARGYNQSELIAKRLAARYGLSLDTGLVVRIRDTAPQTRLSDAERKRNLKRAFAADGACEGKTILLVDDVRTTGATLEACASELKKQGAERIYAATVCCAHPDRK